MKQKKSGSMLTAINLLIGVSVLGSAIIATASELKHNTSLGPVTSQSLYVETIINGVVSDSLLPVTNIGSVIFVQPSDLRRTNIFVPGDALIALDSIDGIKYQYDHQNQRINLQVEAKYLQTNFLTASIAEKNTATAATGLIVNYEIASTGYSGSKFGKTSTSIWTDIKPFSSFGIGSSTGRYTTEKNKYTRFDTTWTATDQETMRSYSIGDFTSGALGWTRSVRVGGVKFYSDFSTRPDLVTFPLPTYTGSAEVPTTVDILLNNVKAYSTSVPSGPFVITNAPTLVGAGQVSVVVRDVMGRDVITTMPLYVDNKLLRKGLSSYSFEAGFLRENYGIDSFRYDNKPIVSGIFSKGLTDKLTVQMHGEMTGSLKNVGSGADYLTASAGLVSANFSYSRHMEKNGYQIGFGHQYLGRNSSLYSQCQFSNDNFRELATISGGFIRNRQCSINGSWAIAEKINVGTSIISSKSVRQTVTSYIASMTYRASNKVSLIISGTRSVSSEKQYSIFAGLSFSFDSGISSSASMRKTERGIQSEAAFSRSADYSGGMGYMGQVSRADGFYREFGRIDYLGNAGNGYIVANKANSDIAGTAGFYGGIIAMDNNLFFTRSVYDAFAVVSTNGASNIPVYSENRFIGNTDKNGYTLVSNLVGYHKNNISIDLSEAELGDYSEEERKFVIPKSKAGITVNFPIKKIRAYTFNLVDDEGIPIKTGTVVSFKNNIPDSIVGYDGQVYVENASGKLEIIVAKKNKLCTASIDIENTANFVSNLGKHICRSKGV